MIKKLLSILFCKFCQSSSNSLTDIQIFMKNHRITFHGFGGLNIRGLVVSEFNYLFRYYSKSNYSLIDFPSILEVDFHDTKLNIKKELDSGNLKEMEHFGVSETTARGNANNLLHILETLENYKAECDRLGISYSYGMRF